MCLGGAHDLPRAKMFKTGWFHLALGGVLKSDDGLCTWHKSSEGMPGNSVTTHIVLDPRSAPGNRTLYVTAFDRGVFKSTDDGLTWERKNGGIAGNLNAWRLVLTPAGILYLVIVRGRRGGRTVEGALYKSADGAGHWVDDLHGHGGGDRYG